MWVFTEFGILMPGLRPAHTIDEGDDRVIQVRSRRRFELDHLRTKYMSDTLGPTIALRHTDYQFRAYCTKQAWADALAAIALDIDYVKFKETAERHPGGKKLHDLYTSLWGRIFSAFPMGSSYNRKWTKTTTKTKTRTVDITEPEMDWCTVNHGKNAFCHKMDKHKGDCSPITLR